MICLSMGLTAWDPLVLIHLVLQLQVKDPAKFISKKSKAVAKTGTAATQWDILKQSGIPEGDIPQFRLGAVLWVIV